MNNQQFPNDLLRRHKAINEKLKKFKRVLFKRFGPNVSDISEEFNQLAIEFKNASLLEYAGLSWQNAAECEHIIGLFEKLLPPVERFFFIFYLMILENFCAEVDFLLKAARSYHEADTKLERLCIRSNDNSFIDSSLQCYNNAINLLPDDSPMKAAVIKEMLKVKPSVEVSSGFASPPHKIHDLAAAANEFMRTKDYKSALDKLDEIIDDVRERNVQHFYVDVIRRNEISRVLLLLLLELPPTRLTESHKNLMDKFTTIPPDYLFAEQLHLSKELFFCLSEIVLACRKSKLSEIVEILDRLFRFKTLETEHYLILKELNKKYDQ
ncbi:hypothetical protein Bhyg_01850 [Pseudolycoriella hygida]|uniref:Uncharacterized protein n=1 Tax=Pseudolycoriella hygida TaxID=35572 RepID=A0A9Q0NA77_9DIPT|nr:hypothetical protein Bhyg_01850 [Pseudolycoriella hygida]